MIFLLGGILNRIRGGWLTDFARAKNWISYRDKIPFVKAFFDISYAAFFTLCFNLSLLSFVILFVTSWIGRSFGWGGYLSSMADKEIDHDRDDILLLDKWFRGNDEPVLSGWAATSVRGLIWSASLYCGFLLVDVYDKPLNDDIKYISISGFAMGSIYLFSFYLCSLTIVKSLYYQLTSFLVDIKVRYNAVSLVRGNGWQLGEFLFGGYILYTPYLLLS